MKKETPETAFFFRTQPAKLAEGKEGKPRQFSGVAYTGKPLSHPFWGQVVFDVESTRANENVPILIEHDRSQRAGFSKLAFSDGQITIAEGTLLDNRHGQEVAADSDAGFPWQMSVHIEPGVVEEVQAGKKVKINGNELTGPATVFRDGIIREVSFTPTGVDYETSAAAMSAGRIKHIVNTEQESMTPEEMKAKIESLQASLTAAETTAKEAKDRAETAEKALADAAKEARMSAVKELFSATGTEFTEAAAALYVQMDEATFSVVSTQMKGIAASQKQNQGDQGENIDHLFSDQVNRAAGNNNPPQEPAIDTASIYAARRAS